jgi:hypothetical protein
MLCRDALSLCEAVHRLAATATNRTETHVTVLDRHDLCIEHFRIRKKPR